MTEIAACGLICTGCDMMEATTNPELAKRIASWFKTELNQDIEPEQIHCGGCHGPRERHWSADCWILQCCIDGRGLENCSQCRAFPCEGLEEWSTQNERYGKALDRLKGLI